MKRFNDVLRLLSSILLGGVVRELDDFQHALLRLINVDGPHPLSSIVAHTTAIALVITFVRNLFGSVQYDFFVNNWEWMPSLELKVSGRALSTAMALWALFGGPYFSVHLLTHHFQEGLTAPGLLFLLMFPISVFLMWDSMLWLSAPPGDPVHAAEFQRVTCNWIAIDACALLVIVFLGIDSLAQAPYQVSMYRVAFVACGVLMGSAAFDFAMNRHFYFPLPKFKGRRGAGPSGSSS